MTQTAYNGFSFLFGFFGGFRGHYYQWCRITFLLLFSRQKFMRISLAYITVILLWATTPLAIKWSGEQAGFLFGVTARMSIGLFCIIPLLLLARQRIPQHKEAVLTYMAVALQIYGAMLVVYWGAQFIPSGWISVIFGLSPFITALLAAVFLKERSLNFLKLISYLLGITGLVVIFHSALHLGNNSELGIMAVLISAVLQSSSAILIKKINAKLPALTQVAGGLTFAVPLYLITWLIVDKGELPRELSLVSMGSIVYLGVIATTIGFALYYYVLTHLSATRVALITLVAPVIALFIGHRFNQEALTPDIINGTGLILSALLLHEFSHWLELRKSRL